MNALPASVCLHGWTSDNVGDEYMGEFKPTDTRYHDRRVYLKAGNPAIKMYYIVGKGLAGWYVCRGELTDVFNEYVRARGDVQEPHMASQGKWEIWDRGKWTRVPDVRCTRAHTGSGSQWREHLSALDGSAYYRNMITGERTSARPTKYVDTHGQLQGSSSTDGVEVTGERSFAERDAELRKNALDLDEPASKRVKAEPPLPLSRA